jgi:hypothetical protein
VLITRVPSVDDSGATPIDAGGPAVADASSA